MKTKIFIISLIGALALLASCNPVEPVLKEVTPENCIKAFMPYFPYSIGEEFIFENESLGHTIQANAYDEYKDGIYPEEIINEGEDAETGWNAQVQAFMFNSRINPDSIPWTHHWVERIAAYAVYDPSYTEAPYRMAWSVQLRLDLKNAFIAYWDLYREKSEMASLLTDTITLPVRQIISYDQSMDTTIVDGACVHIVRNEGIVDFTLDGKTFWRRVKE